MRKKCLFCGVCAVVKNGKRDGVVRYICTNCRKSTSGGRRTKKQTEGLWKKFVRRKQTKEHLGEDAGVSARTVTRRLDTVAVPEKVHRPRPVVVVMDVTFFGREYGVLAARDPNERENLHAHELRRETKLEYQLARTSVISP